MVSDPVSTSDILLSISFAHEILNFLYVSLHICYMCGIIYQLQSTQIQLCCVCLFFCSVNSQFSTLDQRGNFQQTNVSKVTCDQQIFKFTTNLACSTDSAERCWVVPASQQYQHLSSTNISVVPAFWQYQYLSTTNISAVPTSLQYQLLSSTRISDVPLLLILP